jgi:hypothetical protein
VDAVALAATIGGSLVAVAGIGGNVYIARLQRRTEVKLAEDRQQHERDLARGQRLYERRAPVYESTVAGGLQLLSGPTHAGHHPFRTNADRRAV